MKYTITDTQGIHVKLNGLGPVVVMFPTDDINGHITEEEAKQLLADKRIAMLCETEDDVPKLEKSTKNKKGAKL